MLHKFGGSVRLALKDAFPELKIDGIHPCAPPPPKKVPNHNSTFRTREKTEGCKYAIAAILEGPRKPIEVLLQIRREEGIRSLQARELGQCIQERCS